MGERTDANREDELGFLLSRLGTTTRLRLAEAVSPLDLTLRQFVVLKAISSNQGLSQAQLGESLRIDASSIVQVLDDGQRAGLAERRQSPDDRRRYAIFLTKEGRKMLAAGAKNVRVVQNELFETLSDEQTAQLLELLLVLANSGPLSSLAASPHAVLSGTSR